MSLTPPDLTHRSVDAAVRLRKADGSPLADADVTVEQVRHQVEFGCIGFDFVGKVDDQVEDGGLDEATARLADQWFGLFDTATLPFYWGQFEGERGKPRTEEYMRTARWFRDRGARLKGHPLVWHTVTAPWLLDLSVDEIEQVQRERIRRDVSDFAGLVDTWDAINEVVIMPVFDKYDNGITRLCLDRGRIPTIRMAFEEARAANPSATLLLNDFDMSTAYECLIEGVLEAGIKIDAIGLQSHMHQGYWGVEKTQRILDRFSRYGLPLHMTETTLLSGDPMPKHIVDLNDHQPDSWPSTPEGEARQADELVSHYRTLLAHPAVEAITYWGITDLGAWLGAPAGLVRPDGTAKPAYDALRDAVRGEWWLPPTPSRADQDGVLRFSGWRGEYQVTVDGQAVPVTVDGSGPQDVVVG